MGLEIQNISLFGDSVRHAGHTIRVIRSFAIAMAWVAVGFLAVACGSDSDESDELLGSAPPATQQQIIDLTNQARAQGRDCGGTFYPAAGPVGWNADLAVAAARHSQDMHDNDFFAHEGSDRTTVGNRATDAGYPWLIVGENLSKNAIDYRQAIQGWIDSPSHCEALMNDRFVDLGVVRVGVFWTMVLGVQF